MRSIHAYSLSKDGDRHLAKHFRVREFACKDGSDTVFVAELLPVVLEAIRGVVGKAVVLTSAYRTEAHNAAVGGEENSKHLYGMAADIYVKGITPAELAAVARLIMPDWGGVGIYTKESFIHIDVREERADWSS